MTPVIRIDEEVWRWLQSLAEPFNDNPNSVLRRVAGLDNTTTDEDRMETAANLPRATGQMRFTGKALNREWKVGARHALFHKDGTWYQNLTRFPGALFDPHGYVLFRTDEEYRRCPYLSIGAKTNVRPHISAIPGYVRVTPRSGSSA